MICSNNLDHLVRQIRSRDYATMTTERTRHGLIDTHTTTQTHHFFHLSLDRSIDRSSPAQPARASIARARSTALSRSTAHRPHVSVSQRHTPTMMFSLSARHAVAPTHAAVRADRRSVTSKRAASAIVRAEGGESAPAKPAAPAAWSAPKLNPNTPSPIFGGSTGGLLRKAQVRIGSFTSAMLMHHVVDRDRTREIRRPRMT